MTQRQAHWRLATRDDDTVIAEMSDALYREDPSPWPAAPERTRRTLLAWRAEPQRGRALVAELAGLPVGYALLAAYWSNELGGEVCVVDELYVIAEQRGHGLAAALFAELRAGERLWPGPAVAIGLEVTPDNRRARRLYERLGFTGKNLVMHLRTTRAQPEAGIRTGDGGIGS